MADNQKLDYGVTYEHVITLRGDEYDDFEKAMCPDREGVSLGFPYYDGGLEYMKQYYNHGEPSDYRQTKMPSLFLGSDSFHEDDFYLLVWNPYYACVALWVKV